jgi:hypothetical protein
MDKPHPAIHAAALQVIAAAQIYDNKINRLMFSNADARFLAFCLENDIVSEKEVEEEIHKKLLNLGLRMAHIATKEYADHVPSSHALAYALKCGAVPAPAIRDIRFDHGDTAETFMRDEIENLVTDLLDDLVREQDSEAVE